MPIEIGFWNITDNDVKKVDFGLIDSEKRLEDVLTKDATILGEDPLLCLNILLLVNIMCKVVNKKDYLTLRRITKVCLTT